MKPSELLRDEKRWCMRALAVDKNGKNCFPTSVKAVRWGPLGAIWRCIPKEHQTQAYRTANEISLARYSLCLAFLSNSGAHEKLVEVMEAAGI